MRYDSVYNMVIRVVSSIHPDMRLPDSIPVDMADPAVTSFWYSVFAIHFCGSCCAVAKFVVAVSLPDSDSDSDSDSKGFIV